MVWRNLFDMGNDTQIYESYNSMMDFNTPIANNTYRMLYGNVVRNWSTCLQKSLELATSKEK